MISGGDKKVQKSGILFFKKLCQKNVGFLCATLMSMASAYAVVPSNNTECNTCVSCIKSILAITGSGHNEWKTSFKDSSGWNQWAKKSSCVALTDKYSKLRSKLTELDSSAACAAVSICVCSSSTCNGNTTNWEHFDTGREMRQEYGCTSDALCSTHRAFRCASGYWGTASGSTYGTCTACPDNGTSSAGASSQSSCYITSGSNAAGRFRYKNACYYK